MLIGRENVVAIRPIIHCVDDIIHFITFLVTYVMEQEWREREGERECKGGGEGGGRAR